MAAAQRCACWDSLRGPGKALRRVPGCPPWRTFVTAFHQPRPSLQGRAVVYRGLHACQPNSRRPEMTQTPPKTEHRGFGEAEDVRKFDNGKLEMLKMGGSDVGLLTVRPGWRWSNDVKPIAGTDWCEAPHFGYMISGSLHIKMQDGSEFDLRREPSTRFPPATMPGLTATKRSLRWTGREPARTPKSRRPLAADCRLASEALEPGRIDGRGLIAVTARQASKGRPPQPPATRHNWFDSLTWTRPAYSPGGNACSQGSHPAHRDLDGSEATRTIRFRL